MTAEEMLLWFSTMLLQHTEGVGTMAHLVHRLLSV